MLLVKVKCRWDAHPCEDKKIYHLCLQPTCAESQGQVHTRLTMHAHTGSGHGICMWPMTCHGHPTGKQSMVVESVRGHHPCGRTSACMSMCHSSLGTSCATFVPLWAPHHCHSSTIMQHGKLNCQAFCMMLQGNMGRFPLSQVLDKNLESVEKDVRN